MNKRRKGRRETERKKQRKGWLSVHVCTRVKERREKERQK